MTTETLVLSIAMATAAGLVGCFAVMRRMALGPRTGTSATKRLRVAEYFGGDAKTRCSGVPLARISPKRS